MPPHFRQFTLIRLVTLATAGAAETATLKNEATAQAIQFEPPTTGK